MAIPAVTHEYTPGSCHYSTNRMRHHPRWEMRLDSPALHAEQSSIPKHVSSLDFHDGTPQRPEEHSHKTR